MTTASITVTERAAERIAQIVCNEPDKKMFRISVEGGKVEDSPDLLARASLAKRVSVALKTGALTVAELAEHLQTTEDTIRTIIRRMKTNSDHHQTSSGWFPLVQPAGLTDGTGAAASGAPAACAA